MIRMIAAVSANGVIGQENKIPWNYPEDMKFFRKMTAESAVIMGRKTWESIGRLLPKRRNIVISRSRVDVDGLETFLSISAAVESAATTHDNVWLIGGSSIYNDGMQYADEIFLTLIPEVVSGDGLILFPWINPAKFEVKEYLPLEGSELKVARYLRVGEQV